MDRLFIRAWLLFVLGLVAVAVVGIRLTAPEATPEPAAVHTGTPPKENLLILIPAGEFSMGSEEGAYDEKPIRPVFLNAYQIQQYEVTQAQYAEFVRATGHRSPLMKKGMMGESPMPNMERFGNPNQPVVRVSWDDAGAYCQWKGMRLPTEAEWEKGARGEQPLSWPWGNDYQAGSGNFLGGEDGAVHTRVVGSYPQDRSPYGLYDMAGNAREWVQDGYEEAYYQHAPAQNPHGPLQGDLKVLRGASWNDSHISGRTSARMKMFPDYRDTSIGFRCARAPMEEAARSTAPNAGQ
jgi:formylglycine-generating enzyme required for sulfatase activity